MTDVTTSQGQEPVELSAAVEQLLRELTERARVGGLQLTGEGRFGGLAALLATGGVMPGGSRLAPYGAS